MNNREVKIRVGNSRHIHSGGSMSEHELGEDGTGGTSTTGSAIPMADEKDQTHLSDSLTFIRRQLEYFPATAKDVEERKKKGGRHGTVHVGQVGIRCIHCAHRPDKERSTGALAFPASTKLVYQAVRNWQREFILFSYICVMLFRTLYLYISFVVSSSRPCS